MRKICINSKYGFINNQGEVVIKAIYEDGKDFSEGLAFVKLEGIWCVINEHGDILFKTIFNRVSEFKCGAAAVSKLHGKEDRWGFIEETGKLFIATIYEYAENFNDGLAHVRINGQSGFISLTGEYIIKPTLSDASSYSNRFIIIDNGEKVEFHKYKRNDELVVTCFPKFENALPFSDGLAAVNVGSCFNDKWGYLDLKGRMAISPQFEQALSFNEGLAPVAIDDPIRVDLWGYIDKEVKWVIEPQFDKAFSFVNGIAQVYIDNKMGYINKNGKYIWEPTN